MVWKKELSPERIIKKGKKIELTEEEQRLTARDKPDLSNVTGLFKYTRGRIVKIKDNRGITGNGVWKEKK